jgi:Fe-S cluster assembly protein SufD
MTVLATDPHINAQQRNFAARSVAGDEPTWLSQARNSALQRFVALGLPNRRQEAWRFNNLRRLDSVLELSSVPQAPAPAACSVTPRLMSGQTHRIVLVGGVFAPELSHIGVLPPGVWLASLADTIRDRPDLAEAAFDPTDLQGGQCFASLNAALCFGGFVLALDPGVTLTTPVEILHLDTPNSPAANHLRSAILASPGSLARVVETYSSAGASWTNSVTKIEIGGGATLAHTKIQAEGLTATHLGLVRVQLGDASRYESFLLMVGGRQARHDVQVAMSGVGAKFVLNGVYLLDGEQETTIAPFVDHQLPDGQTSELIKGVIAGHAHGVFLGSIHVREGADGTDARQLNRTLMMSPTARIDTKPELTIHADEVKCSHGATVGDLDEAALFYLLSRGIEPATARQMLIEAYAADVFDAAALVPEIDAHARLYLHDWLNRDGGHP